MNDKRDEVIEDAKGFWRTADKGGNFFQERAMADVALSRETELRRKIADDLTEIYNNPHDKIMGREMMPKSISDNILRRVSDYIEKLRGNK